MTTSTPMYHILATQVNQRPNTPNFYTAVTGKKHNTTLFFYCVRHASELLSSTGTRPPGCFRNGTSGQSLLTIFPPTGVGQIPNVHSRSSCDIVIQRQAWRSKAWRSHNVPVFLRRVSSIVSNLLHKTSLSSSFHQH